MWNGWAGKVDSSLLAASADRESGSELAWELEEEDAEDEGGTRPGPLSLEELDSVLNELCEGVADGRRLRSRAGDGDRCCCRLFIVFDLVR